MLLYVLFLIYFFVIRKKVVDPVSRFIIDTYVLLWSGTIILSQTGFYDLNIPSQTTISIVSISLFSFCVGFVAIKIRWASCDKTNITTMMRLDGILQNGINAIIKNKLFLALFCTAFIYVAQLGIRFYAALILMQTLKDVRSEFYEGNLYGPVFAYLNPYFLFPFSTLLLFLFGYMSLFKRNLLWIAIAVFLFIYYSLSGGRLDYVKIIISIIFCAFCLRSFVRKIGKNIYQRYKYHFSLGAIGVAFYVLIVIVTAARYGNVGANKEVFEEGKQQGNEQFYSYYVGPIIAFDYAVRNDLVSKIGGYKLGALTAASVEESAFVILSKMGFSYKRPINDYALFFQDEHIEIGPDTRWNALYTWCNYFYCDFGFIGLVVFPALFGLLFRLLIRYFYRKANIYSASLLLLSYVYLTFTVIQYPMGSSSVLICVLLLLLFSKKTKQSTI